MIVTIWMNFFFSHHMNIWWIFFTKHVVEVSFNKVNPYFPTQYLGIEESITMYYLLSPDFLKGVSYLTPQHTICQIFNKQFLLIKLICYWVHYFMKHLLQKGVLVLIHAKVDHKSGSLAHKCMWNVEISIIVDLSQHLLNISWKVIKAGQ